MARERVRNNTQARAIVRDFSKADEFLGLLRIAKEGHLDEVNLNVENLLGRKPRKVGHFYKITVTRSFNARLLSFIN
ncbi:hypothetical protein [Shewanella surugensis]|uniref:PAS domain S-box protein n=1 Tax=Shewanella surugensis TaxID=212020 RepID=A0ABT0LEB7_9GAMM|nr:hypothetical protein [Shewanella surugensis]MCL1126052.1 hypothetical protein [Shewanella surugensis]